MIIDQTLDRLISTKLLAQAAEEREEHISSGRLTASMLGQPLQWQVLKLLGVPAQTPDEYTLRKFLRGKHVEDWLVGHLPGLMATQQEVHYLGAMGLVDAIVDSDVYEARFGRMPHEVKSVTNAKFKRLTSQGQPDRSHRLQAAFYALGLDATHFAIDYVASDDYRLLCFVEEARMYKAEITAIIAECAAHVTGRVIPPFDPKEPWQAKPEYNKYPEWSKLTSLDCETKYLLEKDSYALNH